MTLTTWFDGTVKPVRSGAYLRDYESASFFKPTHWMPLPEAPREKNAQGANDVPN